MNMQILHNNNNNNNNNNHIKCDFYTLLDIRPAATDLSCATAARIEQLGIENANESFFCPLQFFEQHLALQVIKIRALVGAALFLLAYCHSCRCPPSLHHATPLSAGRPRAASYCKSTTNRYQAE